LNQGEGIVRDMANKLDFLILTGVINAPLQNTATMTVRSNTNTVFTDSIKDELNQVLAEMSSFQQNYEQTCASFGDSLLRHF